MKRPAAEVPRDDLPQFIRRMTERYGPLFESGLKVELNQLDRDDSFTVGVRRDFIQSKVQGK